MGFWWKLFDSPLDFVRFRLDFLLDLKLGVFVFVRFFWLYGWIWWKLWCMVIASMWWRCFRYVLSDSYPKYEGFIFMFLFLFSKFMNLFLFLELYEWGRWWNQKILGHLLTQWKIAVYEKDFQFLMLIMMIINKFLNSIFVLVKKKN